jgi:hypothetical protein
MKLSFLFENYIRRTDRRAYTQAKYKMSGSTYNADSRCLFLGLPFDCFSSPFDINDARSMTCVRVQATV